MMLEKCMITDDSKQNTITDDYLEHYGTKRHSGRYPWGSGEDPYQHEPGHDIPAFDSPKAFMDAYNEAKKKGFTESERVKMFDFDSSSELRAAYRVAETLERNRQVDIANKLKSEGKSLREIAQEMGFSNDSSVRTLLDESTKQRKNFQFDLAKQIKDKVDEYGLIDVGEGAEVALGCTEETMKQALYILQAEYGYQVLGKRQQQMTNKGQFTILKVACKPDAPKDVLYNLDIENRIHTMEDFGNNPNPNEGINIKPAFSKPTSLARNRLAIRYREDGGVEKDGLIEIRRGVKDLSLSGSLYSQVRIVVDNDQGKPAYYLKGMAVYSDDLPDGVDVVINSNKSNKLPDSEVLKKLEKTKDGEVDWENPFKSKIKESGGQYWYIDDDGKEKLGLINKRSDEGDWLKWSKELPAQFLAKQSPKLVQQQLSETVTQKLDEFEELKSINNPAVKQALLADFAEGLDSQAVHLKAASLPRQKYEVILPMNSLKDNECYATNYENGQKLALIRFPHAGPFEIPILTVNNKNQEGINMIGKTSQDAVGINSYNAGKLSGADFDGDTVLAIPISEKVQITATDSLPGLAGFEGKDEYPPKYKLDEKGNKVLDANGDPIIISKVMAKKNLQKQMGEISNLITDMSLMGADDDELARAVRHSMVVVDSPKHKLDYTKSEIDNGIAELKMKYQLHDWTDWEGKVHKGSKGSATLISRAKAQVTTPVHEGYEKIDPKTGKKVYTKEGYKKVFDYKNAPYTEVEGIDKQTGELIVYKKYDYEHGPYVVKRKKSNWMSEVEDAMDLVRDPSNKVEVAYAEFANQLKALANEARKESVNTPNMKYSPEAAKKYAKEVEELNAALLRAKANKPREREAQVMAGILFDNEVQRLASMGETMTTEEEKKIRDRLLKKARTICGAKRSEITINDKQWEAIQAGAITHTKMKEILLKADGDIVRDYATPKEKFNMTEAKAARLMNLYNNGYSLSEMAKAIGASTTTVSKYLKEKGVT